MCFPMFPNIFMFMFLCVFTRSYMFYTVQMFSQTNVSFQVSLSEARACQARIVKIRYRFPNHMWEFPGPAVKVTARDIDSIGMQNILFSYQGFFTQPHSNHPILNKTLFPFGEISWSVVQSRFQIWLARNNLVFWSSSRFWKWNFSGFVVGWE